MDQNSKIQYYNNQYNSMFDNAESEEEIKDSANDSHDKLNELVNTNPLFPSILNIINKFRISHKSNTFLSYSELNQITYLPYGTNYSIDNNILSYFKDFNPKDGDYSIIFKYLKNISKLTATFWECNNLKTITLPNTIIKTGQSSFYYCKNLPSVILPKSIIEISDDCFSGCCNLTQINIPDSVTEIGSQCFYGCRSLTEINIPNSVIYIDPSSFSLCDGIKSITIPKRFKDNIDIIFKDLFMWSSFTNNNITYI